MKHFLCYANILVIIIYCVESSPKTHSITTLINAKWEQTPLHLEIAEYLADEHSNFYWDFVEELGKLETAITDIDIESKQYLTSMEIIEHILSPSKIPLLKLAISTHSLTPRIQAHFQIAREILKKKKCPNSIFVTIGDDIFCGLDEVKVKLLESYESKEIEEKWDVYNFDHSYPGTENSSEAVILYGDIGSSQFREYHNFLKTKALQGDIKYVSRHYTTYVGSRKVRLSGYGVELHLKSTEYKSQDDSPRQGQEDVKYDDATADVQIDGFDFAVLRKRYPDLSHSLERFRRALSEKSDEIAPLKAWEFQDLGLQAAQRISDIQGEEALQILQFTAQNFPTQAKSLLTQSVSDDLKKEMKHNVEVLGRLLNLQPPDSALFINGMFFDVDSLDLDSLMEVLRSELRILEDLHKINIMGKLASSLLALDLSTSSFKEFAIDIRDSAITWINDIENDPQYRRWPTSVMDLLRPTFPGMLRSVRKNLFNLVLIVDPLNIETRGLVKLAESFVIHLAPVRVGVIFDSRNGSASHLAIVCAFNYVSQLQSPRSALGFITDVYASVKTTKEITLSDIKTQFKKTFPKLSSDQVDDILSEGSEYDYGQKLSADFIERVGFKTTPQVLMNGVPLQENLLNLDEFEEAVLTEIMQQTPSLQKSVYRGELADSDVVIDYLMNQPHVMPRLNQRILSTEDSKFIDLSGTRFDNIENINSLAQLSNRDMTATVIDNIKYFTWKEPRENILGTKVFMMTIWIFADLETKQGKTLFQNALEYMKTSSSVRIAFIPNTEGISVSKKDNLNRIVWAISQTLTGSDAVNLVLNCLKATEKKDCDTPEAVNDFISSTELHVKMLRVYSQRVLNLKKSQSAAIINGKIFGPLESDEMFTLDDFGLMERSSNLLYGNKIKSVFEQSGNEEDLTISSDTILKLISILVPRHNTKNRFNIPTELEENYSVVKLPPKTISSPYFDIVAVLDPASRGAQKLAPILILLRTVINCNMRVFLCAVEHHSDMPVKNFYRYVVEPEVSFTFDGKLSSGPYAKFIGLPASPLFTQSLQVPENWLVEVVRSVYDLDNIKLGDIGGPVHSEYELEYLLLEGHCFDTTTGSPPRGLQITLGTQEHPVKVDTIVMANLGYFQLKANPGVWELRLRQGKSSDIYDITSADGSNTIHNNKDVIKVVISSLRSHVIKLRVTKKPDKIHADLLGDDNESSGIWNSITSSFSGISGDPENDVINIFSVASGHLYERLLRIMMLSLMKHTKSPVKFWFLKNYLSPHFIEFLPHMAKEYHFQYELVQYKWPRWLHQQTEKQRTIWGYKILFLDVLFPLDVKKIIFVDADAIVRTDLKELNELELNGAPYAYTPFCDSRKEMEGFRFWKQGYWRNHLMGRRYHISALYVVDLKRFRKIAAGDRLRGQYQALSQDPNSLSNLDQDLPNNMIHQVAIKSLSDEWLWCETWCSTESLKKAKVIDLCNNPLTKEAKLTAAQRIVPEWKDYDQEIKNLMSKVEDHEMEHDNDNSAAISKKTDTGGGGDTAKHSEL